MTRTQDRIKDFVDPQAYEEVQHLFADPARALAAYRFTDATSDLLARWLDSLADLPPGAGGAHALAGLRGVGKSHTLAACGAMIGHADLRSTIEDAHVAISARRLASRRYKVVHVERGTLPTLEEEMLSAFGAAFGDQPAAEWGLSVAGMLAGAAQSARGETLVLLVDTAYGREARVSRDDGPLLSELATTAKEVGAFIALALDDDIAGAEGVNASLAQAYQIDYLEPDHLYQVVNNYLLRKHDVARPALHNIYLSLRNSVPGFNWSEPRFAALYPLHPLVADVAAAVRLHAPTFAFLSFAAVAAQQAVNRPALSLILLDEVFDRTERNLRASVELAESFKLYDELAATVIGQFPPMQRLQVRLILKSLFVLALDECGATARDLCAALLFQDDDPAAGGKAAITRVEEVLAKLSQSAPTAAASLHRFDVGGETRYSFQSGGDDGGNFSSALAASVDLIAADGAPVSELLRALARERFADWPLGVGEDDNARGGAADFAVAWRGASRPGRLIGQRDQSTPPQQQPAAAEVIADYDWELIALEPGADEGLAKRLLARKRKEAENGVRPVLVVWQPAALTPGETDVLRRLVAVRTDAALNEFGEAVRAAANSLAAQAEGIWARLYVDDGVLLIDGDRFRFTAEARSAKRLSATLAQLLAPLFAKRYPQHPIFSATLNEAAGTRLVEYLFGGADVAGADGQTLARLYALPLGLAAKRGDAHTLEAGEESLKFPWVREALALVEGADAEIVSLAEIRKVLRRAPFGLLRDAQHLVLAALVAQRRIELITATGDSLSRRTLRRAIDWDAVTGVRAAAAIQHNSAQSLTWARLLTGRELPAPTTETQGHQAVRDALAAWLDDWREQNVLENFYAAPDAGLTTRAWNLATGVKRTFGSAAEAVEAALADDISCEEALQRAADAFGDAPEQFTRHAAQLEALAAYTPALREREGARAYLAAADPTGVGEIESARRELLLLTEDVHAFFDAAHRERFARLWQAFQTRYVEHYAGSHDRTVGGGAQREALDALIRGDKWREFQALSQLPFVNRALWDEAEAVLTRARQARCELAVRQFLSKQPQCACGFRLSRTSSPDDAAIYLEELAGRGRAAARRTLDHFHPHLARSLNLLTRESPGADTARRAYKLADALAKGQHPDWYTHADARLIARALELYPMAQPLRVHAPADGYGLLTRDELAAHLRQWLDELPVGPLLVELVDEQQTNVA